MANQDSDFDIQLYVAASAITDAIAAELLPSYIKVCDEWVKVEEPEIAQKAAAAVRTLHQLYIKNPGPVCYHLGRAYIHVIGINVTPYQHPIPKCEVARFFLDSTHKANETRTQGLVYFLEGGYKYGDVRCFTALMSDEFAQMIPVPELAQVARRGARLGSMECEWKLETMRGDIYLSIHMSTIGYWEPYIEWHQDMHLPWPHRELEKQMTLALLVHLRCRRIIRTCEQVPSDLVIAVATTPKELMLLIVAYICTRPPFPAAPAA